MGVPGGVYPHIRLYWRCDGRLRFGTVEELHGQWQRCRRAEALAAVHRSQNPSARRYPSIEAAEVRWSRIVDVTYAGVKPSTS